jgi:hypothetical protein
LPFRGCSPSPCFTHRVYDRTVVLNLARYHLTYRNAQCSRIVPFPSPRSPLRSSPHVMSSFWGSGNFLEWGWCGCAADLNPPYWAGWALDIMSNVLGAVGGGCGSCCKQLFWFGVWFVPCWWSGCYWASTQILTFVCCRRIWAVCRWGIFGIFLLRSHGTF